MLFPRTWSRSLLLLGLLPLFSLPSLASDNTLSFDSPKTVLFGKDKKGGDPPRPRPAPGPRDGGDDN